MEPEQFYQIIEARLKESDKAIKLLQENYDRQPTTIAIHEQLKALDRFVEMRFSESERSLMLALQSAKEAAAKTEGSLTKQIDAVSNQSFLGQKAIVDNVDDLRLRMTRVESLAQGSKQSYGNVLAIIMAIVAVVSLGISAFARLVH